MRILNELELKLQQKDLMVVYACNFDDGPNRNRRRKRILLANPESREGRLCCSH